ncbi:MAG: MurT ligase domain-containing protein [Solirubrobacteraceae bacterium]
MLGAKVAAARGVGALARAAGRGGGTSLPGKVLIRLDRHAIGALAARLPGGSAVISATNGKTTSAAMAAAGLRAGGRRLVHNHAGANMAGGVASTLVEAARGRGIDGELGLFEVDEAWLGPLCSQLRPRALLLGNLFRDQLDRYGELDAIADRWAEVVASRPGGSALVLNADDPLVADLGRGREGTLYFGVEDDSMALEQIQHAADSTHCRACGSPYRYEAVYLGHLGRYACPGCGNARPRPAVAAERVDLHGVRSASVALRTPEGPLELELPLPGLYNVYNALGALALCIALGVPARVAASGIASVSAAFGRAETLSLDGRELSILLIKNPAGANEVLRTLALEPGPLDLLAVLNDRIADGRDVSWIWDADFELLAGRVRRVTCGGTRAAELALRLRYAGLEGEALRVVPEPARALDTALGDGSGTLYALPTYTALLELRDLLADRGHAPRYWAA